MSNVRKLCAVIPVKDASQAKPSVIVVNEALGKRIAPHGDPLGKVLLLGGGS